MVHHCGKVYQLLTKLNRAFHMTQSCYSWLYTQKGTGIQTKTWISIAALVTTAKRQKQVYCPSTNKYITYTESIYIQQNVGYKRANDMGEP